MSLVKRSDAGFTLVEMAIVLIVTGIMLVMFITAMRVYNDKAQYEQETRALENALQVVRTFYGITLRYPCPADPSLPETNVNYGREDCNLGGGASAVSPRDNSAYGQVNGFNGGAGAPVLIGHFPRYVQLGGEWVPLSRFIDTKEIINTGFIDGYGNNLFYAVTDSMTNPLFDDTTLGGVGNNGGEINIVDVNNQQTAGIRGDAHYVVYSRGENVCPNVAGVAFLTCGTAGADSALCLPPAGGTIHRELENCDADPTFATGLRSGSNFARNFFDDTVRGFVERSEDMWETVRVPACNGVPIAPLDPPCTPSEQGFVVSNNFVTKGVANVGINVVDPSVPLEVNGDIIAERELAASSICHDSPISDADGVAQENCVVPESLLDVSCGANQYMVRINIVGGAFQPECRDLSLDVAERLLAVPAADRACPPGVPLAGIFSDGRIRCVGG